MGYETILYAALLLLYLSECVLWMSADSVAFVTHPLSGGRAVFPSRLAGNQKGGLAFLNPLPPMGTSYLCQSSPLAFSPEHIISFEYQSLVPSDRPSEIANVTRYDDVKGLTSRGVEVLDNGRRLAKAQSQPAAQKLVENIKELARLSRSKRAGGIERIINDMMDIRAISTLYADFREQTRALRASCNVLWIFLFVAAPAAVWAMGFRRMLVPLIVVIAGLHIHILLSYFGVHRHFFPLAREERWLGLIKMSLCPPISVRATDLIAKNLFSSFHPIAVCKVLCAKERFREFSRSVAIDLLYPLAPRIAAGNEREPDSYYRDRLTDSIAAFLRNDGIDMDDLVRPESLPNDSAKAYCPRCYSEYVVSEGQCSDCPGVSLVRKKSASQ